jgi:hypothetical protein
MDGQHIGKLLVAMGVAIAVIGALFWFGARFGLGSLPGDIRIEGRGGGCFIPIASSILLSLVLTLLLNLLLRWFR